MNKPVSINVVAGVVIKKGGKYLLIQENRPNSETVHGLWNFPAGKVDEGESIEEAAIREAREECGYNVKLLRKLGIFQATIQNLPKHAFEAAIIDGKLSWPPNEILDAKWFTWKEIQDMKDKLREDWVIGAIGIMEKAG